MKKKDQKIVGFNIWKKYNFFLGIWKKRIK
jgi:hypothetical protein